MTCAWHSFVAMDANRFEDYKDHAVSKQISRDLMQVFLSTHTHTHTHTRTHTIFLNTCKDTHAPSTSLKVETVELDASHMRCL
jgi:hypothetical protein